MDGVREFIQTCQSGCVEVILQSEAKLSTVPDTLYTHVPRTVGELLLDVGRGGHTLFGSEAIAREFCSKHQAPNGPELTGADPHAGKYSAREGGKKRGRVRCSVELAGAARNLYFELEF
jgi:hypothetical protein